MGKARMYCPHCHAVADWIDRVTTKCVECPDCPEPEQLDLLSRQSGEGVIAFRRAQRLIEEKRKLA